MAIKKTVLSVSVPSSARKVCIMKAVTKLLGIDHVAVDVEKGKVTVIGTADPVLVVKAVKKAAGEVTIDSIGEHKEEKPPPPKEEKPPPPKEEKPTPDPCKDKCPPVAVTLVSYDDDAPRYCIIL